MKQKQIFIVCILVLLLSGCQSFENQKEPIVKGDTGFITDLDDKHILIKSTYYKLTDEVRIQDLDGNQLSFKDLKIGMKVKPWYEGSIQESFPSKAKAKLLIVLKDSESMAEQKAVMATIEYLTMAASQRFMVLDWKHVTMENVYNLKMMNRSNLDTSFTVIVDDRTNKVVYQFEE